MTLRATDPAPAFPMESKPCKKLLVIRLGSFGDIIHTIPAQQELARRLPATEIHWLTHPAYAPFLGCVRGISRIWKANTRLGLHRLGALRALRAVIGALRRERFDLAVDFQGLYKSALLGRLARPGELRGGERRRLREPLAALFYDRKAPVVEGPRHQVEHHLDLAFPPRFPGSADAGIELDLPAAAESYVERKLEELGIDSPVLLNPGGGWPTKLWPAERFGLLAARIEKELRLPVLFTTGPGEEGLVEKAGRHLAETRGFSTSLVELAALCRRSRLMVAGDTGPMHLAVSQQTPVVALLGPALAWRTGPFNPRDEVVEHARACPHPYRRTCRRHYCMDIGVDEVFRAVVRRLEGSDPSIHAAGPASEFLS